MASALGLEKVAPQCGWEALWAIGWTIQVPRPRHPQAATAEEREAFKKSSPRQSRRKPSATRRPVCTVMWEGRSREALPHPDPKEGVQAIAR
jgi:hypothetical protein